MTKLRWMGTAWMVAAVGCTGGPDAEQASGTALVTLSADGSGGTGSTASSESITADGTTAVTTGDSHDTGMTEPEPIFDVNNSDDVGADAVCSDDLRQVLDTATGSVIETCPPDQGCYEGECVPACTAAANAEGSLGCEFLVPTSPFFANGSPAAAQSGPCHALLVANPWDRPASLELTYDGVPYDVGAIGWVPSGIAAATVYSPLPPAGVPTGQVAVVFLSHRPGVNNGTSLECPRAPAIFADTAVHGTGLGAAFSLTSDTPIQVYDIIPYGGAASYLPSASLLYPSTAWGDAYLAITPHAMDGSEWLLAVAREDNTILSFQPTAAITPGSIANPPLAMTTDYTLNAGEVIQWLSGSDLAGSLIAADRPIGVFSGNTYLRVTTADLPLSGRDSAHQMIPDANALGSQYVGAGLFSRLPGFASESVLYRIMGVVDGTILDWDASAPTSAPNTLEAGQVFEFESRDTFSVTSQDDDHPFSLSQYMSGTLNGQPGCGASPSNCTLGDDDWVTLVPPAQFINSYTFFVDPTYGTSTLVFVREVGLTGFSSVELDCMGTIGGWEPVGESGQFEYAHVELFRSSQGMFPACATSQHRAHSEGNFGVMVWGTDAAASYGYAAGGALRAINDVDLTPEG